MWHRTFTPKKRCCDASVCLHLYYTPPATAVSFVSITSRFGNHDLLTVNPHFFFPPLAFR